ncbi:MAG: hypothetical protein AVO33_09450 [delta proteobacterium ML8_F1]|nr:MAG: hypothetical protein AVO33_09450 [delta proteobacterium ML8_F1]
MKALFKKGLRGLVKIYVFMRYDLSYSGEALEAVEEPFILVSNHVNNADPLLVSLPIERPISFVANERFFAQPVAGYFLQLFEAVPKAKFKSDLMTIRGLLKMKAKGYHIGLFPEGQRSWDGVTGPLIFSTAKLVRLMKMPLVGVTIQGGALAGPRWAKNNRRGRVHLDYRVIMTQEEVLRSSDLEIHTKMVAALEHDEMATQSLEPHPYRGRKPGEGLQRMLYYCPSCLTLDTLRSRGDRLFCTRCGYRVTYGVYGEFTPGPGEPLFFSNTRDWDRAQQGYLQENLSALEKPHFVKAARVKTLNDKRILQSDEVLEVRLESGKIYLREGYPVKGLSGINIQSNNLLEFYIDDRTLIQIKFLNPSESVYKWQQALNVIREGLEPRDLSFRQLTTKANR